MKAHTLAIGQQAGWTQHELRMFLTKKKFDFPGLQAVGHSPLCQSCHGFDTRGVGDNTSISTL
jgi:hypothetical protein